MRYSKCCADGHCFVAVMVGPLRDGRFLFSSGLPQGRRLCSRRRCFCWFPSNAPFSHFSLCSLFSLYFFLTFKKNVYYFSVVFSIFLRYFFFLMMALDGCDGLAWNFARQQLVLCAFDLEGRRRRSRLLECLRACVSTSHALVPCVRPAFLGAAAIQHASRRHSAPEMAVSRGWTKR